MGITIHFHQTHRGYTNGLESVEVEGKTVGECLKQLIARFPALTPFLFEKPDKLLTTIEVYINAESAYPNELAKPVKDGDQIHLTVMLSGG